MVIPIETADQGGATSTDYTGVPANVTFNSGETAIHGDRRRRPDGESVAEWVLRPDRVSEGSPNEATVNIADDDDPHVTVMFAQADYDVVEGETVLVRVALSADPERTVVIPLTATNQGGAPGRLLRRAAERDLQQWRHRQTFTFTATDDTEDDDGESVLMASGRACPHVPSGRRTRASSASPTTTCPG